MNALQPYLVAGFFDSVQKDYTDIKSGRKELEQMNEQETKKVNDALRNNITYIADPAYQNRRDEISGRNWIATIRLVGDLFLALSAFKIVKRMVRILIESDDFPILPIVSLAMAICTYLLSHDIIRIINQFEVCLPKREGSNEAIELQKNLKEFQDAPGFFAKIEAGIRCAQVQSTIITHNARALDNQESVKEDKYHLVRDTFYYPLWCKAVDNITSSKKANVQNLDQNPNPPA